MRFPLSKPSTCGLLGTGVLAQATSADLQEVFDPARYLHVVPGDLLSVDTTSFDKVDYTRVCEAVRAHMTRDG